MLTNTDPNYKVSKHVQSFDQFFCTQDARNHNNQLVGRLINSLEELDLDHHHDHDQRQLQAQDQIQTKV